MRDPRTIASDDLLALVSDARWFAAKGRALESAEVVGVPVEDGPVALAIVEVRFAAGTHEHYLVALGDDDDVVDVLERQEVAARLASLAGVPAEGARVRRFGVEQSNSSVVLDELHVLKLYRRLEAGPNPELEVLRALGARRFANAPRLEGALETTGPPVETALASVTALVPSLGGGWELTLDSFADDASWLPERAWRLGEVTASLHAALAANDADPSFAPEEPSGEALGLLAAAIDEEIATTFSSLPEDDALGAVAHRSEDLRDLVQELVGRGARGPRDPDARRLPPRPGALDDRRRLGRDRLRGRAGSLAPGAAAASARRSATWRA